MNKKNTKFKKGHKVKLKTPFKIEHLIIDNVHTMGTNYFTATASVWGHISEITLDDFQDYGGVIHDTPHVNRDIVKMERAMGHFRKSKKGKAK